MDDAALVRVFKALGHENRFRLFVEIWRSGSGSFPDGHVCFLSDVMSKLNVGAPTISHHLKELVAAGLIHTEKQGKFVICRVNPKSLGAIRVFFARA